MMQKSLSKTEQGKKKILLIMPGKLGVKDLTLPLPLLFISKPLIKAGYKPVILDCRVKDYKKEINNLDDFLCVGITATSGIPVKYALEVSKYIKRTNPNIKIIWGGHHASALSEQTASDPNVDIAVRGEGEKTIVEIADAIQQGKGFEDIEGISFKGKDGKIISTPDRPFGDINKSAGLPYHLVDIKDYPPVTYKFGYASSKGCPCRCGFCSSEANCHRKWIAKSPEVVVNELEEIMTKFHPKRIAFVDANVFVDRKRVEEICNLIIKKNWDVEFYAMIRCDYIVRYPDEFFQLLKKAHFKELAFGAESGNQRVLDFITKDITVKNILDSVVILKRNGFIPIISLIVGFPSETEEELEDTIKLREKIKEIDKNAMINSVSRFAPLPGTRLTNMLIEKYDYHTPSSLEEWAKWNFHSNKNVTWANSRLKTKYETLYLCGKIMFINDCLDLWSYSHKKSKFRSHLLTFMGVAFNRLFNIPAKLRWKNRFFYFPIELKLWEVVYNNITGLR